MYIGWDFYFYFAVSFKLVITLMFARMSFLNWKIKIGMQQLFSRKQQMFSWLYVQLGVVAGLVLVARDVV